MVQITISDDCLRCQFPGDPQGTRISNDDAAAIAQALRAESSAKVAIIAVDGADFCLGRRLPPADPARALTALEVRRVHAEPALDLITAISAFPAPVLTLVQGRAFGLGLAIAAASDITVASADARFKIPEMQHGFAPTIVMSTIVRRLPYKIALRLVLEQNDMSARDALTHGVVTEVVEASELEAAGLRWARLLASLPAEAVADSKRYLSLAGRIDPDAASALAASMLATVVSSRR